MDRQIDPATIIGEFKEQKPVLRNGFDAVTLALHSVMKKLGFSFLGFGTENVDSGNKEGLAPSGWDASSDSYSFRYRHPTNTMIILIKSLVMGESLLVNGLVEGNEKNIQTLELTVSDYIAERPLDDFEHLFKNLDRLISNFQNNLVSKLIPNMQGQQQPTQQPVPRGYDPNYDPLRVPNSGGRGNPRSPLMEDRPFYGQPPFGVGSGDLYPGGFGPFPGGPFGGNSGNLVGPNHPGFGPFVSDPYGGLPFGRGGGRPPPGARYDPFGPPRGDGFGEPNRDEKPPEFYDYL